MLIICENDRFAGSTPQNPVPWNDVWRYQARGQRVTYVRWPGSDIIPAGVYLQRYEEMWELGRRVPVYIQKRLNRDDLVQELSHADHPGNQS